MSRRSNRANAADIVPTSSWLTALSRLETPLAFVDFLKSGSADTRLRRIVFFNSRGGNVVASMVFGHILRGLRIAGVVGRFEADGDPGPYVGECLSACVYALMGAVRRVAPPGSEVGLHRMSIVESEGTAFSDRMSTRSFADPPMVAVLGRYARRMGVDPALVQDGRIAAARHRPCSYARGNAALVVGDKPILIGSAREHRGLATSARDP